MAERRAATLMVQGTGSGVGKSLLTSALCRIYARRGFRVLPFKAQNMSNNADVTISGGEIGRAQALQARAAGVEPDVRMNPVLLKPLADTRCDVVVLGRSRPELAALPWHERKAALWPVVTDALDALRRDADLVVIEGAGSPAETNLRHSDIVNMAVARYAGSPVLLVADIDRGGAFAALFGTWGLLDPQDRGLCRGFVLNRFRGDSALLDPAPRDLERRTGVPTVGVVPRFPHRLPEEDAEGLETAGEGAVVIAAVRLPHVANFDDLDPLAAEAGTQVRWVADPAGLEGAAAVVLPGTRNTLHDLDWLWRSGLAAAIRARAGRGAVVVGLCGGFQMLGTRVADPHGVEAGGERPGLGLLDVETELGLDKLTTRTRARVVDPRGPFRSVNGSEAAGYEIHHGRTVTGPGAEDWLFSGDRPIGARSGNGADANSGRVWGAYLHGLFQQDAVRSAFLASLGAGTAGASWHATMERELDRVADIIEESLDMNAIDQMMREGQCALSW